MGGNMSREEVTLGVAVEVLRDLFTNCAMINRVWGEGSNHAEAADAIKRGKAILAALGIEVPK